MRYIKFWRYILPFWKKEALILSLSGLTVVLGLISPYLTKLIIDDAYGKKDPKLFIILVAVGGIIFVVNGALGGFNGYLNRYIKMRITFDLNRRVFKKLQSLPFIFFQDAPTGENLYKISYDVEQAGRFIAELLPQMISLIPRLLLILIILLCMNWKVALFALALAPFLYIVPSYFGKRLKEAFKGWIENMQAIFSRLQETLSHMRLVKAFGQDRRETKSYIKGLIKNIRYSLKNTRIETAGSFANSLINRLILGLIIFYGGWQVIKGRITLGSLSAMTIYLSQLSGMQSSFAQFFQQISTGLVSYERLDEILEAEPDAIESVQAREVKFPQGRVQFKDVAFGFSPDKTILKGMNFIIDGASCAGLVGPSGCGKTTIVNLLLRLYKPEKGEIWIDGWNITDVKSKSFYNQIGVALQEPYLWNDTIADNIRYGREDASLEEVRGAARIACIDEFINSLPKGWDTVVGETGCKISEGQKQRIAIARAVIKRPKILILDEALASIDAQTEEKIIGNIRGFLPAGTVVVISHRISTIAQMDMVYFLAASDKMFIGRHEGLLRNNPAYQNYLASQAAAGVY